MYNIIKKHIRLVTFMGISFTLILNMGCQFQRTRVSKTDPLPSRDGKTVVLSFRAAISQDEEGGVIRNPLSGAVFMAESIPPDVPDKMTAKLFSRMQNYDGYELIGLQKARNMLTSPMSSDRGRSDMETFRKVGLTFSADSVMIGYIYRWRERKGTDYSVDRPASVAFDLYLVRIEDGAILWKERFDKTQTALSENILDVETFFKGKGKWMTAESLADLGLSDIMDRSFPEGNK